MPKDSSEQLGHIPKADDLHDLRDMLYIILQHGGSINKKLLYQMINQEFLHKGCDKWAKATYGEYLAFMDYLAFAKFTTSRIKLYKPVLDFLNNNSWTKVNMLSNNEKKFFRKKLLKYKALIRFLEVVFCDKQSVEPDISNIYFKKILLFSKVVKDRKVLSDKWMRYCKTSDDRDSRALLSWCLQTDIVAKDDYSDSYFLISSRKPDLNSFKLSLIKNYPLAFDQELKRARIPDIRVKVCADLHMPISNFDKMLDDLENRNPKAIFMDRASNTREEVAKYGLKRKSFYYYYLQLDVEALSHDQ